MAYPGDNNAIYIALDDKARQASIAELQPILANTIFFQQLYKKYHWHVEGADFYQLHLLFDKHAGEQLPLIDTIAERIRTLGGVAEGMPPDVVKNVTLKEPTEPRHNGHTMITNILAIHEDYIGMVRKAATQAADQGDDGTNDILVSDVLRTHELECWFIRSSASRHEA